MSTADDYPPPFESPNVQHLAPLRPGSAPAVGTDPYGDDSSTHTARRPAHWPDLDAWRALTEEQRQERTRTLIAAAAPLLGVQPTADGRHLEITPTVRAQVSSGRLYVSTIRITDDPAAVDTARERLAAAGWTVYPLERIAFEAEPPVPTVRILVPGEYLDAYRAAPRHAPQPRPGEQLMTSQTHWVQVEPRRRYRTRIGSKTYDLIYQGRAAVGPGLDVGWYLEGGLNGKGHEFMAKRLRDAADTAARHLARQERP